jgi:hypothetical protein
VIPFTLSYPYFRYPAHAIVSSPAHAHAIRIFQPPHLFFSRGARSIATHCDAAAVLMRWGSIILHFYRFDA